MEILLPPHLDHSRDKLVPKKRSVVIIGANGAGKSRFTDALVEEMAAVAFRVSALNALYNKNGVDTLPNSIDKIYDEAVKQSPLLRDNLTNQFDKVSSLLLYDEVLALIKNKIEPGEASKKDLKDSKLDIVAQEWRDIFPDSKILHEGFKLLFRRDDNSAAYSSVRLSDGEKAVLYIIASVLYAPKNGVIFVDNPGMFLHPSLTSLLWERVEMLREDCTFIYTTNDLEFLSARRNMSVVWVRRYDAENATWDYTIIPPQASISEDLYVTLVGARKPVLFIEGDSTHSIDAKLYPLVFTNYTVKSLGSCNKVIEATRTFNDLNSLHQFDSYGIVDRDRRDAMEVKYLREKKIFVPEVAEIENILMLEDVIKAVASACGKDEDRVFSHVKKSIMGQFKQDLRQQALLHTRHRVKRTIEYRIDGRFPNIGKLEEHMMNLVNEIKPRALYEGFCQDFHGYLMNGDYQSVLRVYNQKSMIPGSNVAALCGLSNKDSYIHKIISILKHNLTGASRIRNAIIRCFGIDELEAVSPKPSLTVLKND